jgi:hypothetical protein
MARYAVDIVRQSRALACAQVQLVIWTHQPPARSWFFRLYEASDRRLISVGDDSLDVIGPGAELDGVAEVPLENLTAANVSGLDLLLDLRAEGATVGAIPMPALGLWWLFHGARPPGAFWELVTGEPLTMVELRGRRESRSEDRRLGYVAAATKPGLSWVRNRQAPYRTAVTLVTQMLRQVHERGWERTAAGSSPVQPNSQTSSQRPGPSNLELASWLIPAVLTKIARRLRRRTMKSVWRMALRETERPLTAGGSPDQCEDFHWLTAPAGRHYADPFLIQHQKELWCFFEDIDGVTGRGRIAAAEINPREGMRNPVVVLERPYHLSYPCVFRDGEDFFMIPESSENGTIDLYRCVRFPDQWKVERVVMREIAVDTTLCAHDGRYWLFTTRVDPGSQASELWLFSSESLAGAWTPHPQNPISLDVRNTRSAGAIVARNGRLFRPSQDCSIRYGRRFTLNEIVTLTPERFDERPIVTVEPRPGFVGTHSYAQSGSVEMIDGCVLVGPRDVA